MIDLAKKWNQRFADATLPVSACGVLQQNLHLLPPQGQALDLACGLGGNAIALAQGGLQTQAWDISDVALTHLQRYSDLYGLALTTFCVDISSTSLPNAAFDVIVVSHFLDRDLCKVLTTALKPGGLLYYQTFTVHKLATTGPSSSVYLLQPGELLQLFSSLAVVYYREDGIRGDLEQGERNTASFIGQKR